MLTVKFTITGDAQLNEAGELKAYMEYLDEAMEKLREMGSAELEVEAEGTTGRSTKK